MKAGVPILCLLILIAFAFTAFAEEVGNNVVAQNFRLARPDPFTRLGELDQEDTIFFDDFEGEIEWESIDQTSSPAQWRVSDFQAYQGGLSWWCGDPAIPGYDNAWLQYLDTPIIDLSDAVNGLTLEFRLRYGVESGNPTNPDYDGWDGCNVWISTNAGLTWDVLEDPSRPYEETSLLSFGLIHGMGPGIPGWSGISGAWFPCTFDLDDYIGEPAVQFRFALASDAGICSRNNPLFVSYLIDEVLVSDGITDFLENDAEGIAFPDDFEPQPQGGTGITFELQTQEYHSATHAWQCENGENLFSRLISPPFEVPSADRRTFVTYWVYCDWPDADGDGDNTLEDYYQIEVLDNAGHYEMIGYDYGYNGSDQGWVLRTDALMGGEPLEMIELTAWAEQTVQVAFRTRTDDDQDGGVGSGLYIDDFAVLASAGWDHDVAVYPLNIPFPTTAGRLIPATATFANIGNNPETFVGIWYSPGPHAFTPNFVLDPDESETRFLDLDANDGLDGWVVNTPGDIDVYARAVLQADENTGNNQTNEVTINVRPAGEYELGYDSRYPEYTTTRFNVGEGPITHFLIPEDLASFTITWFRVLWNGDLQQGDLYDYTIHVFDGGDEPGQEIWSDEFTVSPLETNPNWQELEVTGEPDLENLESDFWVWFEITDPDEFPHIVFAEQLFGFDYHFNYDGTDITDSNADWMIRVVGTAEAGPPPQEHFHPVEPTGLPYPIIAAEAFHNEALLNARDEIGIFDEELCVGAAVVTGEWALPMNAWGGDPDQGIEGFVFGHPIIFKIWSFAEQREYDATATYLNGHGNGTFGFGAYSEVSLETITEFTLTIQLAANYFELISTNVVPPDLNAPAVFGNINTLEIVYQDDGHIYIPPNINTIGNITLTEGYQIFCLTPSQLVIEGPLVAVDMVYDIYARRWNWIGYPYNYNVNLVTALDGILNNIEIVMTDDGRFYIPPAINTIGSMRPGEGYFIFVTQDVNLVYSDGAQMSVGAEEDIWEIPEVEGAPQATGLPYITLFDLSMDLLAQNPAVIELYDGALLVGKAVVLTDRPVTPVVAWGGSVEHQVEGFISGHPIRIAVKTSDGVLIPTRTDHQAAFGEDAYASISLDLGELPSEFTVGQGYPNPFNPSIIIPFTLPANGDVAITVHNVLGQQVFTSDNHFNAGYHRFVFDTTQDGLKLVSGIYFIQVQFNNQVRTQKIMLLK